MRKLVFLFLFVVLVSSIYASCEKGQIDINSASEDKLTEIINIGPARAEQIVNLRPFSSVEDLIRVSGIGGKYIENIKSQGLACVEEVQKKSEKNVEEKNDEPTQNYEIPEQETKEIILDPQVIKTDDSKNFEVNYTVIGFVAFSIFIIVLFLIKNRHKTEFE